MTRPPALEELLAPPVATTGAFESRQAVEDLAEALLHRLRQEELDAHEVLPAPSRAPREALTPEAGDALYAWGVLCYADGRHDDAAALFGALARRQPPTLRLWRALGANHLARGDGARAAEAFAQVSRLSPEDAEALFFRAEAECLRSRRAEARALLQEAARLARAQPAKWPGLKAWCDELRAQTEGPPSAES